MYDNLNTQSVLKKV